MEYNITKHAKERYAERIMGRDNPTDIARFLNENDKKVTGDLQKMVKYGKKVYVGQNRKDPAKTDEVYLNDTWIVVADEASSTIITVFKIDLGVGEEFNKEYVEKLYLKLQSATEEYEQAKKNIDESRSVYLDNIRANELSIKTYKDQIKNLEKQNDAYRDILQTLNGEASLAHDKVRDIISTVIGKKIW